MPINLSRVRRCDQAWDDMPTVTGGRMCMRCSRTIVDFRRMTSDQIAAVHLSSDAPVCGLYHDEQLLVPESAVERSVAAPSTAAFSLVALLLLEPGTAPAQTAPMEQVVGEGVIKKEESTSNHAHPAKHPVIIHGKVLEQVGGGLEPVPFAVIHVRGTELMTESDLNGLFSLDATAVADTTDSLSLEVMVVGFSRQSAPVNLTSVKEVVFLMSGHDEVAFGVTVRRIPLHKRIWRGIARFFRR